MSSIIELTYKNHWRDFSLLGKSMKRYAIASWIIMGVSFISILISMVMFIFPMFLSMDSNSIDETMAIIIGLLGILIIINLITITICIYQLYAYIQYLIRLKKVGDYTHDIDLQTAYKMELWALLTPIIISFILILLMFIIGTSINQMEYDTFIMLIFGFLFISFLAVLIPKIFQLISVFAFDRWGQRIKMANLQNPYTGRIGEGTNFMKWGKIISIFFGTIGMIIFLIGFMNAGKNIMEFFDDYGNLQSTQGAAIPQSSYSTTSQQSGAFTTSPSLNASYMGTPSYGSTTMKPQTEGFCAFCGSKLDDKNSMFCSNCGRKLF